MAVEELNDRRRLAELADALVEAVGVEHVEEPDLPVVEDGVRRPLHELRLVRLPAEPAFELFDDPHPRAG
jgi:hypothetical protein